MAVTKVTRNFQITLPKEVREGTNIKIGDTVRVDLDRGEIKVKKLSREEIIERVFGSWKGMKEDSVVYVRKMRAESERRMKRLGL